MDVKKALEETFHDIIRFVAAVLYYLTAPLRAPRAWPARVASAQSPPNAGSFGETRLLYFLSLAALIFAVTDWFSIYLLDPIAAIYTSTNQSPEANEKIERIARQIVSGSVSDPFLMGCLLGALVGTAALEAWLRAGHVASLPAEHAGLLTVALSIANIYFIALGWFFLVYLGAHRWVVDQAVTLLWSLDEWLSSISDIPLPSSLEQVAASVALAGVSASIFLLLYWLPRSVYRIAAPTMTRFETTRRVGGTLGASFGVTILGVAIGFAAPSIWRSPSVSLSAVDLVVTPADAVARSGGAPAASTCALMLVLRNPSDDAVLVRRGQGIRSTLVLSADEIGQEPFLRRLGLSAEVAALEEANKSEQLVRSGSVLFFKSTPLKIQSSLARGDDTRPLKISEVLRTRAEFTTRLVTATGRSAASRPIRINSITMRRCFPDAFRVAASDKGGPPDPDDDD